MLNRIMGLRLPTRVAEDGRICVKYKSRQSDRSQEHAYASSIDDADDEKDGTLDGATASSLVSASCFRTTFMV